MIRNKYAAFGLFAALVLVFWNLFDWLYASFITGSGYSFGAAGDLIMPLTVGIVTGYLLFLRKGKE